MTRDIDVLVEWIRWCLIVAAVCTTAFPVLYLFSGWHKSLLGRILMAQGVAFAVAIDVTLLFQYWTPHDILVIFWVDATVFFFIAATTAAMTVLMVNMNYVRRRKRKEPKDAHPAEQDL